MPSMVTLLQGSDLGFLHIVAEQWGIDSNFPNLRAGADELAAKIVDKEIFQEVYEALSDDARQALEDLVSHGGRIPWLQFTERHGEVRKMGAARRDRERPDRAAISPAERLWYHALVGHSVFEGPNEPLDYAYIPDDFLPLLPAPSLIDQQPPGRPAAKNERVHQRLASDEILDDAATLLAARRMSIAYPKSESDIPEETLSALLKSSGLLDSTGHPISGKTRQFLEKDRGAALLELVSAWKTSPDFDELRLMPELHAEGDWQNKPIQTRTRILNFISNIPENSWWSLSSFIAAIKDQQPDFQRPAGDFDSWYLKKEGTDQFLTGYAHWDEVDGAFLLWVITGPLHWLGLADLAAPDEEAPPTAFRFSEWATGLLAGEAPPLSPERGRIHIRSNGQIGVPRLVPRTARYQIARFADWENETGGIYRYRFSPESLERAANQGLHIGHLITILSANSDGIPPNITMALKRWEKVGPGAKAEDVTVLRATSPEVLDALRNSRAKRFLGAPLSPTAIIIKTGAAEKVLEVLTELGWLGEIK